MTQFCMCRSKSKGTLFLYIFSDDILSTGHPTSRSHSTLHPQSASTFKHRIHSSSTTKRRPLSCVSSSTKMRHLSCVSSIDFYSDGDESAGNEHVIRF